jgi:hypothetical protein
MRGAPITRLPASLELHDPRKSGASDNQMSSPGSKVSVVAEVPCDFIG